MSYDFSEKELELIFDLDYNGLTQAQIDYMIADSLARESLTDDDINKFWEV